MRLPSLHGVIRRRMLINYRADPQVAQAQLPAPFRPKLHQGKAIVGICLIRLEQVRPSFAPSAVGIASENAAHRIAVTWDDHGMEREGVYIPRRDTNSLFNRIAGGRLFPGTLHPARFDVHSSDDAIDFRMQSRDGSVAVDTRVRVQPDLPATSSFASLDQASAFFQAGSLGYSATTHPARFHGMTIAVPGWRVESLEVAAVHSSYFSDPARFPAGSIEFDCALLMRNLDSEWRSEADLCA